MFYNLSPQVEQCVIITYKHAIYELSHELLNGLRLRKLGKVRKLSKPHRIIAENPGKIEIKALLPCAIPYENYNS